MGWFESVMQPVKQIAQPVAQYAGATAVLNPTQLLPTRAITNSIGGLFGENNGQNAQQGGGMMGSNAAARNADMEAGYKKGREIFYDDPDMQDLRNRRMDLSKGYNGQELGAMRAQAQGEIQGQRSAYLKSLQGRTAKAGIGGARAAAMGAAADKGFQQNRAEMERKMALDNAGMVRQGTNDLQDFLFRQKYGTLGTGLGYAQLGVADRNADAQAAIASKERPKGLLTQITEPFIGGLI